MNSKSNDSKDLSNLSLSNIEFHQSVNGQVSQQDKPGKSAGGDILNALDDTRVKEIKPLIPPQILMEDLPLTDRAYQTISTGRRNSERIIQGMDDRLLVVVGPCSIHDVKSALEYAHKLLELCGKHVADLQIVMRVYFEKPRTTVGWKGLINDPFLDGTFAINRGLRIARDLLLKINELGIPTGCEFLDSISPQYTGDLVTWGAIGARTTESQVHRELASGLSVPVGFKNGTDGNVQIAIDAIKAAKSPHHFLSVTKQGLSAIVCTSGNDCCHVILRGGDHGPNYAKEYTIPISQDLTKAGVNHRLMVDCSHGNSSKNHKNQKLVVQDVCAQISSSDRSNANALCGVMIESHLVEGRQNITKAGEGLVYGQSITDACIGWDETVELLEMLSVAVRERRNQNLLEYERTNIGDI